eukprot:960629-Prorocentrum_minimum.AAC.1
MSTRCPLCRRPFSSADVLSLTALRGSLQTFTASEGASAAGASKMAAGASEADAEAARRPPKVRARPFGEGPSEGGGVGELVGRLYLPMSRKSAH